jgi:GR25 family glycosyltransferase involved in LPS biosynthesis
VNPSESSQRDSWAFFDKIYCISLDSRPDRKEQARKQFASVGVLPRVDFVIVAKHSRNQEEGIFNSHMCCLKKGLKENARRILIFEDDVFFQRFDGQVLYDACSSLGSTGKWNGLFLGCITDGSRKGNEKNLARITYRCLAHAYALNAPFARHIVQQQWSGIPYDELLRRHGTEFYALSPMCAFQGLAGSDNQTVVIDRARRMFGGLPFIQKANEFYQNNKLILLPVSLAVVLALFAFLTFKVW